MTNSRPQKRSNSIWRRRQCVRCHTVFTSVESPDLNASVVVRSPNAVEPFSRDKLLLSVHDSLRHRKTATEDATALTDTIIGKLLPQVAGASLDVRLIVAVCADALQRFDKVAATHYQAFHPN